MDWRNKMTTKEEMIEIIKAENPTLRVGSEENGYRELSADEYDAVINEWADNRIAKELAKAEAETNATKRAELLSRLGITEEEARILLG